MHSLTEILAISPFYQLLPKQDVAPLVAPKRVLPQALDPEQYLSLPTRRVLEAVGRPDFDSSAAAASPLLEDLNRRLEAYENADLDKISFRRPVIAADSGETPAVEPLPGIFAGLSGVPPVSKDALVDMNVDQDSGLDPDLDLSLKILSGKETEAELREHVSYFREKLHSLEHKNSTSRKRAFGDVQPGWTRKKVAVDRSQLADSRLDELNVVFDDIFDNGTFSGRSKYAVAVQDGIALSRAGLAHVDSLISALEQTQSVGIIPFDHLSTLQDLCVSTMDKVGKETTIEQVSNALQASSILLRILNSNLDDRRLYVDTRVDHVVDFLVSLVKNVFESSKLNSLGPDIASCFDKLTKQLTVTTVDEQILSKIEFMCVEAIFSECKHSAAEEVSASLVVCLVRIFKCYAHQRSYIVNEMLSALKTSSANKPLHRQLSVSSTSKVSFFTVFLVRLVQSFDAFELRKEVTKFAVLQKSSNPNSACNVKRMALVSAVDEIHRECLKTVNEIADFILHSLQTPTPSFKAVCSGICDDLVVLLPKVEWPGAETLFATLGSRFIEALGSESTPAALQPFLLELVGKFATTSLKLKLRCTEAPTLDNRITEPEISKLKVAHEAVLSTLRDRTARSMSSNTEFQHELYRSIHDFATLLTDVTSDINSFYSTKAQSSSQYSTKTMEIIAAFDAFLTTLSDGVLLARSDTDNKSDDSFCSVILARTVNPFYSNFISALTRSLESKKAKLTTKAIKVLSPLIELDSGILLKRSINGSVSSLLVGDSALSRDAVIDLLGQYMFSSSDLLEKYYKAIGQRYADESISVRKRVLKLMKRVYQESPSITVKTYSMTRILKVTEDEETSVVELAATSLDDILFKGGEATLLSQVLVETLGLGGSMRALFKKYIFRALSRKSQKTNYSQVLKQVVAVTLDRVIDKADETLNFSAAFQLIAVLTECDASVFTQDQLIFLQSFLVKDPGDTSDVCFHALQTTKLAIPQLRVLRPDYVTKTRGSLLTSLTKFDTRELHEAVQILQSLPSSESDYSLIKAAISSMKLLMPYFGPSTKISSDDTAKICKLLHLLGAFASYCNFESSRQVFERAHVGLKGEETVVSLVAKQMIYLNEKTASDEINVVALRNLLSICTFHPQLFLSPSVLKVLDTGISQGSSDAQLVIVGGLLKFLAKEDEDAVKRNERGSEDSVNSRDQFLGKTSQNLNDGVCSSLVQRYINTILAFCVVDSGAFSETPVLFLQLVLQLGFANPKVCVPTIIALEASPNRKIKRIAQELHKDVFDKHESLADRNYVEAVRLAGLYVRRVNRSQLFSESLFLRSVYRIVSRTYSSKKKFVLSLCRLFDLDLGVTNLEQAIEQRDITIFLAMNLSVLNFTSLEEIYLLLYHLDRAVTRDGIDLAERISLTIGSKDGEGMSVPNLQLLFVQSQAVLSLIYLRQVLTAAYDIRSSSMEGFRPSRADIELRAQPKVVNFVDFPLSNLELDRKLTEPNTFGPLFTRMVSSAKDYTI